jgi:hypothetical protein
MGRRGHPGRPVAAREREIFDAREPPKAYERCTWVARGEECSAMGKGDERWNDCAELASDGAHGLKAKRTNVGRPLAGKHGGEATLHVNERRRGDRRRYPLAVEGSKPRTEEGS